MLVGLVPSEGYEERDCAKSFSVACRCCLLAVLDSSLLCTYLCLDFLVRTQLYWLRAYSDDLILT